MKNILKTIIVIEIMIFFYGMYSLLNNQIMNGLIKLFASIIIIYICKKILKRNLNAKKTYDANKKIINTSAERNS